jgi:hypothetical protein
MIVNIRTNNTLGGQGYWKNRPLATTLFIFILPLHVSALAGEININKHLKKLLRGTVLPITLLKYAQQDAEPKNKKHSEAYAKVTYLVKQKLGPEW